MDKRASLEVIAPTVEDAVAQGLSDLGLTEDAVEVEVLDSGSRGLFGIGSRQARVRLTIKSLASTESALVEETWIEDQNQELPAQVSEEQEDEAELFVMVDEHPILEQKPRITTADADEEQEAFEISVAEDVVRELLARMKVEAEVKAAYCEPDEEQSRPPLQVDIYGDDLSILIGPKAETLNALQYIAGLIIGKELGKSVPLVIDVEGYRARRKQQIRQLARRMADQALKTGRRQALEPMPAGERRLVHIELRNYEGVVTESVGEEPRRKVTIVPK